MPRLDTTASSIADTIVSPATRPARSSPVSGSSVKTAVRTVTSNGKTTATMARIQFTRSVETLIHSLRMASINVDPPAAAAVRRATATGGRGTDRYSCSPAVARRKASSSEACCGESSCSTTPPCAASSPTRSMGRSWTSMPSGPAGSQRPPARWRCSAKAAGAGVRTRTQRVAWRSRNCADRTLLDEVTAPDDDEVVGHQRHLREEVARHEDGATLPRQVDEHVADPADALGVEPVRRLVEEDRVRIAEQHAGQAEALAHAERVPRTRRPATSMRPTISSASSMRAAGSPLLAASHRRWLRPERPGCTYPASSSVPTSCSGRRSDSKRLTVERRGAPLGAVEADHAAHRRALARAVRTEEAGDLAGLDVEAEIVDGDDLAEALGEVADLDHHAGRTLRAIEALRAAVRTPTGTRTLGTTSSSQATASVRLAAIVYPAGASPSR